MFILCLTSDKVVGSFHVNYIHSTEGQMLHVHVQGIHVRQKTQVIFSTQVGTCRSM